MTYLTIEIPDNKLNVIDSISALLKKEGINTLEIDSEPDLSEREFLLLQEGYKEAMLIKSGKMKPTPISELWNE